MRNASRDELLRAAQGLIEATAPDRPGYCESACRVHCTGRTDVSVEEESFNRLRDAVQVISDEAEAEIRRIVAPVQPTNMQKCATCGHLVSRLANMCPVCHPRQSPPVRAFGGPQTCARCEVVTDRSAGDFCAACRTAMGVR